MTTTVRVPSISGTVLTDPDGDGTDDGDGAGLAGATVKLFIDATSGGTVGSLDVGDAQVGSTITTDGTGAWTFSGTGVVVNRTYFVVRTNPTGYASTNAIPGSGTNSTATKVDNDQIKVVLGALPTSSANNKFLATVACTGPSITTQPSSATKNVGESVTFSVAANGTAPLAYQWRKNGIDISGATSSSYTISSVATGDAGSYDVVVTNGCGSATSSAATLTVNKYTLTVTPDAQTKEYGEADPSPFTFQYSGFVGGDTASVIDTAPTCGVAGAHVNVASYTIACSGGADNKYTFSYATNTLTVTKATLTVTPDDKSREYGEPNGSFTVGYTGFKNGQTLATSDVTGAPVCSSTATATSTVAGSPYPITCTIGTLASGNYSFTFAAGELTVTKATLTVTPDDKSREYGEPNGSFTVGYTGFKNGQTLATSDVTGAPVCSSTATATSTVAGSPYPITCTIGTLASGNYSFTFAAGELTVTKATLTVTPDDKSREYGEPNGSFTVGYTGFKNGQTLATSDVTGAPVCSSTATATSTVAGSPYPITCTIGTLASGNYSFTFAAGELTVTKATLTVTPDDKSREYGEPNGSFTVGYTGFKNGQTLATSDVTGAPVCSSTATATSTVAGSPYPITCTIGTLASGNYSFTFAAGELTVTKATLTVTPDDKSREYGEPNGSFTVGYTGFKNGQTLATSDVTGAPVCSSTATATSTVAGSPYPITCTIGTLASGNYSFTFAAGELTVTKATLTVTPDDKSREYGEPNGSFTVGYTGFKNGQTLATSDVTGAPVCSSTATATSTVAGSPYPITCTIGTLASGNYSFTFAAGELTVTKATLTVTPDDKSREYGEPNGSFTVGYTGFKNGQTLATSDVTGAPVCSSTATATSTVAGSPYPITCTIGTLASGNYSFTFAAGELTVTKATLTVTPDDKSREYGEPNGSFTVGYTGFKNGQTLATSDVTGAPVCSSTATATSTVAGSPYPITCTIGTLASGNYSFTFAAGELTVTKATLTVTPDDKSREYGEPNGSFTVGYTGFKNGQTLATSDVTGAPVCSSTATATSTVAGSPYPITCTIGTLASGNYSFTFAAGELTVTKATLTVTPDDKSREYGEPNGSFTVGYTGFKNGQTLATSDVTGAPVCSSTATATSTVAGSPYPITCTIGTLASGNYSFTFAAGELTVTKATLTVTPDDKSREYGEPNGSFTVGYTGFKNGQTLATSDVTGAPVCSSTATATSTVAGSPYPITCTIGTLASGNYSFTFAAGELTVTKATLTVTPDDKSREYGEPNGSFTVGYTGFKNGQTLATSDVTGAPVCSSTATATSTVAGSPYPITCTIGTLASGNYSFTFAAGELTVTKATLTVTPDDKSREYGEPNGSFTVGYTGFKNGQTLATSDVTGAPVCSSTATATSTVAGSPYPITCTIGTLASGNYSFTFAAGELTVTKATLTVTPDDKSREYGEPNGSFTVGYTGFKNGQTLATSDVTGAPVCSSTATATSTVAGSPYPITCTIGTLASGNYSFTFAAGELTVTKATLTVTPDDKSREYGEPNGSFTVGYTGFKNGQTLATSDVTGAPVCSSTATATSTVAGSPYPITCTIGTLASGNYSFTFAAGELTVTKATLTVTPDDKSREYGEPNGSFTVGYTGFKNGQTLATSDVTGAPVCSSTATATSTVAGSPYPITCTIGTLASGNYSFTFAAGELTVTKATLTVTPDDKSREYGEPNGSFTVGYTGFKNGQTLATSDVTGAPVCSSTATATSTVAGSPYPITCTIGTLASGNYSFTFAAGELTVTKATLTVTPDDKSREYGEPNGSFTVGYTGFKNGQTLATSDVTGAPVCSSTATATSTVAGSPYPITCTIGTLASGNYSFTFAAGELTVTKATLTVTPDDKSREYGEPNGSFTVGYTGFKNGQTLATSDVTGAPVCSSTATATSTVAGSPYPITCTIGTLASGNYSFTFAAGELTVTKATLTIKANNATKTYGNTYAFDETPPSVDLTVTGLKNSDTVTNVTLASPGAAASATVAGSPYTITPSAATGSGLANYDIDYQTGRAHGHQGDAHDQGEQRHQDLRQHLRLR